MLRKTYGILLFIIGNVNWSTNYVEYDRFARERREILEQVANDDQKLNSGQKLAEECSICSSSNSGKYKRYCKDQKEKGFINDVLWMLEYHKNGLMQLIMYSAHVFLLALQVFTCTLYTSFPTARDPVTHEFTSRWLRYAENFGATDYIHKFDSKGRYNRMLGVLACQCLILRLRAFFSRLKTAKNNRYRYEDINIVDLEFGYASEIRCKLLNGLRYLSALVHHDCFVGSSLSGQTRRETLEFNRKVRCLSKMDKIYYYNQIDFNTCFVGRPLYADYYQKIEEIDRNHLKGQFDSYKPRPTWTTYLFSINLPNKISYVALPEHRVDLAPHGMLLYALYITSTAFALTVACVICSAMSYISFLTWNKVSKFALVACLFRTNITILLIILNVYDSGLLALCSVLFLSRSRKIVTLFENEIELYRYHLKKLSMIDGNNQLLIDFKKQVLNMPCISTGFKRRLEGLNISFGEEKSSIKRSNFEFSFMREHDSFETTDQTYNQNQIDELIAIYKKSLKRTEIVRFNENIRYLLDLVEVLQYELNDHKRFFTLLLDVNVIFGTLGCSISLGVLMEVPNYIGAYVAVLAGLSYLLPMIFSLSIGASSEAAVRKNFLSKNLSYVNHLQLLT